MGKDRGRDGGRWGWRGGDELPTPIERGIAAGHVSGGGRKGGRARRGEEDRRRRFIMTMEVGKEGGKEGGKGGKEGEQTLFVRRETPFCPPLPFLSLF